MSIHSDKCRSKALKNAVGISGVESVTVTGQDKDQVELVGDGIDSVELTRQLRKNVAHAELLSVGEVKKEEQPAATTAGATPAESPPVAVEGWLPPPLPPYGFPPYHCCTVLREPVYESPCTMM
ncbi:hypothetical protein MIMGU_mgv1a018053mg [Erythranthe guttata]|uniref:HMA domain-containing protein n=1 Tax=Erythranthe guttata TaxID=4155 RepID=A0A022PZ73_ERYGU|nr:PREDICTED: uncharacterized protein LOC105976272 [Erythranthe guttata]EYU21091.1 hypothetical protein MIMGU_mgv1a018053mg [Erythranthe guttata]|eukprot:XP_012857004.1 PREDICTED: uncharacterized protein LOC105976272 [Erythranthe guttata]